MLTMSLKNRLIMETYAVPFSMRLKIPLRIMMFYLFAAVFTLWPMSENTLDTMMSSTTKKSTTMINDTMIELSN